MMWTMLEKVPRAATLWGRLCFATKSLWRPIWIDWLVPYFDLVPTVVQIRGQDALPDSVLSHHVRMVGGALLGDTQLSEYLHRRFLQRACGLLPWNAYPMRGVLQHVYVYP
jgi:hypothetical protein